MKVTLIQTNSGADRAANLDQAARLMEAAVQADHPDLIILPEYFDFYAGEKEGKLTLAEDAPGGSAYTRMRDFAIRHKVWVHAGSLVERIPGDARVYNTTVVFDREGREVARYRKINMFDIVAPDGTQYRESATVKPGTEIMTYDLEGFRIGGAICFDLRFYAIFEEMMRRNVDIIALPAAFTLQTGKDHWEVLCRARAIETQTYFLAPGQTGTHLINGERRMTYGHSLVCDPWGHVVAKASDGVGFVSARLERAQIARARSLIPMHAIQEASCTR
ncbi:carbon-nitrogen hydrolase family protein [Pusillimonas sp. TS35]|nr:carbon-nitrogen hydrolase family protein [Pusillimonas sp. TS35]